MNTQTLFSNAQQNWKTPENVYADLNYEFQYKYKEWANEIRTRGYHNQVLAKKFYDALVDLFTVEVNV